MAQFNPNDVPLKDAGIFGLPLSRGESEVVLIPVPWDVTTSYGAGTSRGPQLVLDASAQIDLFDLELGRAYEAGYFMEPIPQKLLERNDTLRKKAERLRELGGHHVGGGEVKEIIESINAGCEDMNRWVYEQASRILSEGKQLGLVGGDHSSPLGAIQAVSEKYAGDFGVLHLDAHADLRNAYEGFIWSHASIMYNVMTDKRKPKKLVQVGIRDFCEEEFELIQSREDITTYFDADLKARQLDGEKWSTICDEIVRQLPTHVYLSWDIDGLDPKLCPHTGTPVPGGLSFAEAALLLTSLHRNKKKIVGFDLNEVSAGHEETEWDGNVGARLLYKMCGWTVITHGLKQPVLRKS